MCPPIERVTLPSVAIRYHVILLAGKQTTPDSTDSGDLE
jgi:hypothetical protein